MSRPSFYFYDLETSGINPADSRIMQFAGQRTDTKLKAIGPPLNCFIKLTEDVLPDPQAILITGITPQLTLQSGLSEVQFLKKFHEEAVTPDTIFLGYNTIRFDDEFMRYIQYRNFYDPYEWQWRDGRSRWDLLDVTRMTRALRPEGINWPFDYENKISNRLELLTAINKLDHRHAHDALDDVMACIALARLILEKQPKLFNFLLEMHDKQNVAKLALGGQPFIYTSGKYPSEFEKTTVVYTISEHPRRQAALVYDLRYDPTNFFSMTPDQLAESWRYRKDAESLRLPIKTLSFNRCPAIAPISVLDEASAERLKIDRDLVTKHYQQLKSIKDWPDKILQALQILDDEQEHRLSKSHLGVDSQLYKGFFGDHDKKLMTTLRNTNPGQLQQFDGQFKDSRLKKLLPLYKARNYPELLTSKELQAWHEYVQQKLFRGDNQSYVSRFEGSIKEIIGAKNLTKSQQKLIDELKAYAANVISEAGAADK